MACARPDTREPQPIIRAAKEQGVNNRVLCVGAIGCSAIAMSAIPAHAQSPGANDSAEMSTLRQRIEQQSRQLESLKRAMAEQEANLADLKRALGPDALAAQRGGAGAGAAPQQQAQAPTTPVGQAPQEGARPQVAPIFEQPGILTPKDKFVIEPSLQYSYSSSNRVALVGYTIIPAILIGAIDIREVRRSTFTGALTGRYGLSNRFEVEAKVPYVYRSDTGVGREFLQGASINSTIFDSKGHGVGDIEVTGRYQFNDGGLDKPYYVGSLRFKSRTGKDPFQVQTSNSILGFTDEGIQTELPTGSGFYGLQPAVTMLYPSDPAVFFGTVNYLYTFARNNVTRNTDTGVEVLGKVAPGGIFGFNFGMGLGLNEKSSFSIGYDHSSVGRTKVQGSPAADSIRVQLGTLILGYSYRLSEKRSLNVSLGAGLTRDTPDVTLTVRLPTTF
jgi:hypothetical protein